MDRIELILKSIAESKFSTFLTIPVHSVLLQRASFIFPLPKRTFRTPWSSFQKFLVKKIFIKNHCISPRYTVYRIQCRVYHLPGLTNVWHLSISPVSLPMTVLQLVYTWPRGMYLFSECTSVKLLVEAYSE